MSGNRGFTLIEMAAGLAVGGMIFASIAVALVKFQETPRQGIGEVTVQDELRRAIGVIREDASQAQSFESATSTEFGTFRWLDFSTFPAERHRVRYFWEDRTLIREAFIDGDLEDQFGLVRRVESPGDVSFSVASASNPSVPSAEERVLTVAITATIDAEEEEEPFVQSVSVDITLRPEQTETIEFQYYFLHNGPAPPSGSTTSQADLPMDATEPTASTLNNYDTNRDSSPGLGLVLSSAADEEDDTRHQDWLSPPLAGPLTIDGRISLFVATAAADFTTGKKLLVLLSVSDLDPGSGVATLIGNRPVAWFTSTPDWSMVTVLTDVVSYTVAAGHRLKVTVQFGEESESNGMLAYDTISHIAFLMVPSEP